MLQDFQSRCVRKEVDVKGHFSFQDLARQLGVGQQVADSDSSRRERLGKRFQDDEVGVLCEQVDSGAPVELTVGLVDQDQGVGLLEDGPEVLNDDPYGEGWLVELQADAADLAAALGDLLDADGYRDAGLLDIHHQHQC